MKRSYNLYPIEYDHDMHSDMQQVMGETYPMQWRIYIYIYPTYPKTTHEIRGLFSCRMRHPLVERWRGAFLYRFFLRWRCFGEPKDADLTWENDGYPGISAPTVLGAIYLEITWDGGLLDQSGRAKSRPTAPKWAQERFAKPKERFTRSMHAPCCLDSHKQCKDICTAGGNAQDPERNPPAPPDIKVDLLPPLWVATLIPGERGQVRVRISTYITRKQR